MSASEAVHDQQIQLRIISANGVRPGDITGKSDPYCVVHSNTSESTQKTKAKTQTLDPVWEETFIMDVGHSTVLTLEVFDWDRMSAHSSLGQVVLALDTDTRLKQFQYPTKGQEVLVDLGLELDGVPHGILHIGVKPVNFGTETAGAAASVGPAPYSHPTEADKEAAADGMTETLLLGLQAASAKMLALNLDARVKVTVAFLGTTYSAGVAIGLGRVVATGAGEGVDPVAVKEAAEKRPAEQTADMEKALDNVMSTVKYTAVEMHAVGLTGFVKGAFELIQFGTGIRLEVECELETLMAHISAHGGGTVPPGATSEKLIGGVLQGVDDATTKLYARKWSGSISGTVSLAGCSVTIGARVSYTHAEGNVMDKQSKKANAKAPVAAEEGHGMFSIGAMVLLPVTKIMDGMENTARTLHASSLEGSVGGSATVWLFGTGVEVAIEASIASVCADFALGDASLDIGGAGKKKVVEGSVASKFSPTDKVGGAMVTALSAAKGQLSGYWLIGRGVVRASVLGVSIFASVEVAESHFSSTKWSVDAPPAGQSTPEKAMGSALAKAHRVSAMMGSHSMSGIVGAGVLTEILGTGVEAFIEIEAKRVGATIRAAAS